MRASDLFLDGLPTRSGSDAYEVQEEIGHGTFSEVHLFLFLNKVLPVQCSKKWPQQCSDHLPSSNLQVHRARHKTTGDLVALKYVPFSNAGERPLVVQRELAALKTLEGLANVVELKGTSEEVRSLALFSFIENLMKDPQVLAI